MSVNIEKVAEILGITPAEAESRLKKAQSEKGASHAEDVLSQVRALGSDELEAEAKDAEGRSAPDSPGTHTPAKPIFGTHAGMTLPHKPKAVAGLRPHHDSIAVMAELVAKHRAEFEALELGGDTIFDDAQTLAKQLGIGGEKR